MRNRNPNSREELLKMLGAWVGEGEGSMGAPDEDGPRPFTDVVVLDMMGPLNKLEGSYPPLERG